MAFPKKAMPSFVRAKVDSFGLIKIVVLLALLCIMYMCYELNVENKNTKQNIELTRMQLNEASVQKRLYEENIKNKMLEYQRLDSLATTARQGVQGHKNEADQLDMMKMDLVQNYVRLNKTLHDTLKRLNYYNSHAYVCLVEYDRMKKELNAPEEVSLVQAVANLAEDFKACKQQEFEQFNVANQNGFEPIEIDNTGAGNLTKTTGNEMFDGDIINNVGEVGMKKDGDLNKGGNAVEGFGSLDNIKNVLNTNLPENKIEDMTQDQKQLPDEQLAVDSNSLSKSNDQILQTMESKFAAGPAPKLDLDVPQITKSIRTDDDQTGNSIIFGEQAQDQIGQNIDMKAKPEQGFDSAEMIGIQSKQEINSMADKSITFQAENDNSQQNILQNHETDIVSQNIDTKTKPEQELNDAQQIGIPSKLEMNPMDVNSITFQAENDKSQQNILQNYETDKVSQNIDMKTKPEQELNEQIGIPSKLEMNPMDVNSITFQAENDKSQQDILQNYETDKISILERQTLPEGDSSASSSNVKEMTTSNIYGGQKNAKSSDDEFIIDWLDEEQKRGNVKVEATVQTEISPEETADKFGNVGFELDQGTQSKEEIQTSNSQIIDKKVGEPAQNDGWSELNENDGANMMKKFETENQAMNEWGNVGL